MSTASLFHLPRSLISSREIPLAAAETAAPFLREWPEKQAVGMPACRSISLILSTRYRLLNGPKAREKRGWEGSRGNRVTRFRRARTGHNGEEGDAARRMETPWWKGSVFEEGRVTVTEFRSMETWRRARRQTSPGLSHVNSPDRRKPAN